MLNFATPTIHNFILLLGVFELSHSITPCSHIIPYKFCYSSDLAVSMAFGLRGTWFFGGCFGGVFVVCLEDVVLCYLTWLYQ